MLDRKTPPAFKMVENINIKEALKSQLDNGIPVYSINAGTQELVKIEFIFDAGTWHQEQKLVASTTNAMLNEGTKNMVSKEIVEKLDFYGAYLLFNIEKHKSTVTLYTLNRYLTETLAIANDVILNSVFPEKEFETINNRRKQRFIVDKQKVETMSRKALMKAMFGDHPYGQSAELEDFEQLTVDKLKEFYKKYYQLNNCSIIVSGLLSPTLHSELNRFFGKINLDKKVEEKKQNHIIESTSERKILVPKEDAQQSSIRIGKVLINKLHPDYFGMQVLNTIFGGYFASRLMMNIREDKGYTYGIYSVFYSQQETGLFYIATEVGTEVCEAAISEIYKEINLLRDEKVDEAELSVVRNHLLAEILKMFDGAFAISDSFRSILDYNLDYTYFQKFIKTIKTITPEQIQDLAIKYMQPDSFIEVVAGKR